MNKHVWVRRFAVIFSLAFLAIAAAQLLRGRTAEYAVLHALGWAAISAIIFVAAQARRERRQQRCAICDAVDGSNSGSGRAT
jgi:hypothetical protein